MTVKNNCHFCYRELYKWEEQREKAIATFNRNKAFMMMVSVQAVATDLKLNA